MSYLNKIAVIIPTFNRGKKLISALKSVLSQSYKPKEIIIVDDGSTDDTKELLSKHMDKIIYIKTENSGVATARNRGIKKASSLWIAFLDSDDVWLENKLKTHMDFHMKNSEYFISQSEERWIRGAKSVKSLKKGDKLKNNTFIESTKKCLVGVSSVMIHRDIFNDIGLFDENFEVCEDYDLWLRILKKYKIKTFGDELIIKYGGVNDQLSNRWGMDIFRIKALEKHISCDIYKDIVIEEIISKCNIVLNGANKRGNSMIAKEYSKKLLFYKGLL